MQSSLQDAGVEQLSASDLSYIVVLPILLLLLFPLLIKDRHFLKNLFRFNGTTAGIILAALAIGLLFRVAWWSQLIVRISFGLQTSDNPAAIEGPVIHYQCPTPTLMLFGIVVYSILIPVTEEIIHRGYVQTFLHARGPWIAVAISALIFAVFHRFSGMQFALAGGIVLGIMYWLAGSLWPPLVTHAVVNLTPLFTWRCMNLSWNPSIDSLPLWMPGISAIIVFLVSTALLLWLLFVKCRGLAP